MLDVHCVSGGRQNAFVRMCTPMSQVLSGAAEQTRRVRETDLVALKVGARASIGVVLSGEWHGRRAWEHIKSWLQ